MKKITKYVIQSLFLLHVLLIFLWVFESKISVPFWVQPLGRMHPLILHFPVAFVGLLVFLTFLKKSIDTRTYNIIHFQLLLLTAFFTILATLMGFLLSLEGYESEVMRFHKWLGIGLSIYMYLLVYLYSKKIYTLLLYGAFILVIFVGHYGASLTHGSSFITEPLQVEKDEIGSTSIYQAHIQPILNAKCKSCHNNEKSKGGLNVTSIEAIKKGGKHGDLWIAGEPEKSLLVQRALLPLEDKEHMAPEGKPQLTKEEIKLLSLWIKEGANDTISVKELKGENELKKVVVAKWAKKEITPTYGFDVASYEIITKLKAEPYISLKSLYVNSPALEATILGGSAYNPNDLKKLLEVKEQLVSLNLSNLKVTDIDLHTVKEFKNLERLWLNFTEITNKGLVELKTLEKLKLFSAIGTNLDNNSIEHLQQLKHLEKICIWNTQINKEGIQQLTTIFPNVSLEQGIKPSTKKSTLAAPKTSQKANVKNTGDVVFLKHIDPEVVIKYSINSKVKEDSEIYTRKGIVVDFKGKDELMIKAKAFKKGKKSSKEIRYKIYRKGVKPASLKMKHLNYVADYFGNAETILIDDFLPYKSAQAQGWSMFTTEKRLEGVVDLSSNHQKMNKLIIQCATYYRFSYNNVDYAVVYGANNQKQWKLIDKVTYSKKEKFKNKYSINLKLKNTKYKYYKVIVQPGKNRRFFVGQMFFY